LPSHQPIKTIQLNDLYQSPVYLYQLTGQKWRSHALCGTDARFLEMTRFRKGVLITTSRFSKKTNSRVTHSMSGNLLITSDEIGQVTCCRYNADKRQASTLILFYKQRLTPTT
jgi:hypothetical protein